MLGDVEASLADALGVGEVTVVTAGTTRRGMGVVAYYVAARGADIGEEDLMRHCRDTLPGMPYPTGSYRSTLSNVWPRAKPTCGHI